MPNDETDFLSPSATINRGFALVERGLGQLTGDAAEPSQLTDARTHLNAASVCIGAFLGEPARDST